MRVPDWADSFEKTLSGLGRRGRVFNKTEPLFSLPNL